MSGQQIQKLSQFSWEAGEGVLDKEAGYRSFKITQGLGLLELDHQLQFVLSPPLHTAVHGMQRLTLVFSWLEILSSLTLS